MTLKHTKHDIMSHNKKWKIQHGGLHLYIYMATCPFCKALCSEILHTVLIPLEVFSDNSFPGHTLVWERLSNDQKKTPVHVNLKIFSSWIYTNLKMKTGSH